MAVQPRATAENSEQLGQRLRMWNLSTLSYVSCGVFMIMYSADVLSDIMVGIRYLISGELRYAVVTFVFYLLATFLCNLTATAPAW